MIDPQKTIHVCVHVQEGFFNPSCPRPSEEARQPLADKTAAHIGDVAASLAKKDINTLWMRFNDEDCSDQFHDLYKVSPAENDRIIEDYEKPTGLRPEMLDYMEEQGLDTILVSGGYASLCVTEFVQDAMARGFNVQVMKDCLMDNQDDMDIRGMFSSYGAKNPASFIVSDDVFTALGGTQNSVMDPVPPTTAPSV